MARLRSQRLALLGAGRDLAGGQRVVGVERPALEQRHAAAQLETLDGRRIHIHALRGVHRHAVALPRPGPGNPERGRRWRGNWPRSGCRACPEAGVERRQVAGQACAVVVNHAQLRRGAGFGTQLRIAQQRPGALRAQADDAVGHQVDVRRLVALAHAALESPRRRGVPDQVAARAPLAAELLVAVVARAQGQRQVVHDAPLVLGEQRPLVLAQIQRRRDQGVLELLLAPLAAHGEAVALVEQRHGPLGVEDPVVVFRSRLAPSVG